ncbi:MAG: adenylate/guanylate cyclase domain-containing protein, partial [Acidimicrobiales bacterium]
MGVARPVRAAPTGTAQPAAVVAPFLATAHRRWLADEAHILWRRRPVSLLFGDVSGLTALAEHLAANGNAGAEELTDTLNSAVGRLLDAAAAHGGDLLKLGGDAVLLAFEGPGHERRATQAATALPTALRGLPGESLGVQLGMSIGVATGELDLFLVGDDHRELIVCGPLLSTTVRLEHAAEEGEVVADGTTAAAVNDARWSGLERGGHVLLIPPPASTVGLGLGPNGAHELPPRQLLTGIPVGLRHHVGIGGEGEHRQVAVACIQVMGVDDLLVGSGHATVAEALDAVVRTAQEACANHHTTFLSTVGDDGSVSKILVAGAPDA